MNKATKYILEYIHTKEYNLKDKELFMYGLNIFLRYLLFGFSMFLLLLIMGNIKYILIFDIILIILRFHCGGYHATSISKCFILSIITLVIVPEIVISINIDMNLSFILITICFVFMFYLNPLQNANKMLSYNLIKQINTRKKIILIIIYILYLLYFIQSNISAQYANMVMLAFLCNVFSIMIELVRKESRNYV